MLDSLGRVRFIMDSADFVGVVSIKGFLQEYFVEMPIATYF